MPAQKLTDLSVRKAKPKDKPYKLSDGGGLYLHVMPNGSKYWRYQYRYQGKPKVMGIGVYPTLSLTEARGDHTEAHALVKSGLDPVVHRQLARAERAANQALQAAADRLTFEKVAIEWHDMQMPRWSDSHAKRVMKCLERELFPDLGAIPIAAITTKQIQVCIEAVDERGALDHAKRTMQRVRGVFRFAQAKTYISVDPTLTLDEVTKLTPRPTRHRPALDVKDLPAFWQRLDKYSGHPLTRLALNLLMLTMVRPGELRFAKWAEFDIDDALWTIPPERMKVKKRKNKGQEQEASPHLVPLSRQALQVLDEIHPYSGHLDILFPSALDPTKPVAENTWSYAMHRMGYKGIASPHGFRTLGSTELNGTNQWSVDAIELQLAHIDTNKIRAAYNRGDRLPERRKMLQWLADYYDSKRPGANITPIRRA